MAAQKSRGAGNESFQNQFSVLSSRSPVRTRRPRACISSLVLLRTGNWELSCTLLRHHLRIGREREQREILAVQVVLQVEHAREARAGEESLVPGTVFILRSQKIGHAAGYAF